MAGDKKLPVVKDPPAPAKPGKKPGTAGWGAFTDGGTAPRYLIAARVVMVIALAATIPTILGVSHGSRILWTMCIAALPLFWVVAGYHVWRRICPLAVVGQVGRLLGRPGTRKVEGWLTTNYLYLQLGLMLVGMSFRLVATNGSPLWLAGFLAVVVVVAAMVSLIWSGKTWCNLICPVGLVEKIYTEPAPRAAGGVEPTSQCSPCVACKKHCPDIDLEQGYWKEMPETEVRGRRLAYYAWPGIVTGFYVYYYLVAETWDYYFTGAWAYETDQASRWLDPGFYFATGVPRVVAAPLTLIVAGALSFALFALAERVGLGLARRRLAADASAEAKAEVTRDVRHQLLTVAGFLAINCFYFFAGQPSLRRLPSWVVHGWGVVVVFATAAIFFRRWKRRESEHVQERFAQKILRKWEWGDAPPSDDLKDIYLLHNERTKQREARLRAYKETVRELVADGLVTKGELVILDSLRAQLGVSDKDHAKILAELSAEERQLFDPAYQGSVEQRLKSQQYKKALERLVIEAASGGVAPSEAALASLAGDHGVAAADAAAELAHLLGPDGPITALIAAEVRAIERLAAAARAAHAQDAVGSESATLRFVAHTARWRGSARAVRALGLLAAMARRDEIGAARTAIEAKPAIAPAAVHALRGTAPDALVLPLHAALEALWHGGPEPLAPAPLLAIVDDPSRYLRAAVVIVLSRFDDDGARAALVTAMDDGDAMVRQAAVRALGARARLTRELLQKALADVDPKVKQAAVRAVAGGSSGEYPAADPGALAQTVKGIGNAGVYATLDANARVETLTEIERLMLLRQVPMFGELAPDDLDDIAAVVVEQHLQPGGDVCKEGDAGDAVYLLVKGKVRVFTGGGDRPERTLSELGPGACIGEMAVFDAAPRSATVRALERTRLLVVPGREFKDLLAERPAIGGAIITELVRRMRGMMAG